MENQQSKFYNKDKSLSQYSFGCGYIEVIEIDNVKVWLEPDSACFHVRASDYNSHKRLHWESYESLTEARREFYKLVKNTHGFSKKQYLDYVTIKENRA